MHLIVLILGAVIVTACIVASATFKKDAASLDVMIENSSDDRYASRSRSDYIQARDDDLAKARAARIGAVAVGILFLLFSIVRIVPANSVAVPTSFGSIGQPVKSGLHITTPWTTYHNFSTRIQESQRLASNEGDKKDTDCVRLNVGSQASADACVDATVRYIIDVKSVSKLYRRYGGFSDVNLKLIRREVESGLKEVYGDYNTTEAKSGKTLVEIQRKAKKVLGRNLNRYGIRIDSVTIGDLKYTNPSVEQNIAQKLAAEQQAEKAVIDQRKALTEAETRLKQAEIDSRAAVTRALGEAEANRKIAETLTPELARLRALEALAGSKGNVTVIEGANGGTPVIVGGK